MKNSETKQTNIRTDADRYRDLSYTSQQSWWESDLKSHVIHLSDYISDYLGLKDHTITFDECINLIREDYKELMRQEFFQYSLNEKKFFDRTFPIIVERGETWIRTKYCFPTMNGSKEGSFGIIEIVNPQKDTNTTIKNTPNITDTNKFLKHMDKVAMMLSDFLTDKQENEIVINILKSTLDFFNCSNSYIVEFTKNYKYHNCIHNIMTEGLTPIDPKYFQTESDSVIWTTNMLKSKQPIVIDSLYDLPPEAGYEYKLFNSLNIKSVMMIPLVNNDYVWGYVGINTIGFGKHWSNEDYMWMLSIANILGICIELNRERRANEESRLYKENLLKNMPIGYARFHVMFDKNDHITNYTLVEVNQTSSHLFCKKGEEIGHKGSYIHDKKVFCDNISFLTQTMSQKSYIDNETLTPSGHFCRRIAFKWGTDEVVELLLDISETKEATEAAKRSDELFRHIFNNMPVGAIIYDSKGYITDLNKSAMDIFGLTSKDDIKNHNLNYDKNTGTKIQKHIQSQDLQAFSIEYDFDSIDTYKTSRHGKAKINLKFVPLNINKVNIGFMLICIEDTDPIVAINKVRDFENYFSLISEHAKIGYAKVNILNYSGYAIRQWYKNVGENEDTPMYKIVDSFDNLHPEDKTVLIQFLADCKNGKATHLAKEMRVRREGTKNRWNWIYHNIIVNNYAPQDGIVELTGLNYDITELKEVEHKLIEAKNKAQEMDKLKSAFLANISHEIRTPLNAIVGFSSLLANGENPEDAKEYFELINRNSELLLSLINDILDLSTIEAGTMEFVYKNANINVICSDIIKTLSLKVTNNVKLVFIPTEESCVILTDAKRLIQLITNFINNAIKFTTEGSITLTYKWIDDEHIRFSVTDTGIGIEENKRKNIFDRFVKLNPFAQGTGLGLSICQSIVQQMDGTIGVDSKEGKGSCFWFILPKRTEN